MKKLAEGTPTENEYYARISRKLKNVRYIALLCMVISAVLILWAYRDGITYDNFRYLLRDVDTAGHTALSGDTVYYAADDTNTYLYFRDDLAVGSSQGVAFHRALGSRSFTDDVPFKSPILRGSDKYMIAYDAGGYSFYVYNSISRVYSDTLDTPILSAAAADNGNFALLTRNSLGSYVIAVYDRDFHEVASLTRNGEVYNIGFFADGRLWFCESLAENAALYTDFSLYTVGAEALESTQRESGLVLDAGQADGGFYLLTDHSLSFRNKAGEKNDTHSFGTAAVLFADASEDGVAVYLQENASGEQCTLRVYFADGKGFSASVAKGAKGIALCGKRACLLYDGTLLVTDGKETNEIETASGTRALLGKDKNSVIVCMSDYARIYEIK